MDRFRKKFSTLCSLLNSASLCIFSTLLQKSEENCFTNIPHPLTKTFCKQPCDWLINRGWRNFSTLWHIQYPTEPAEVQYPLGVLNSAYRACWKCFLKQKIYHSLGPKADEANSAGCRGCWISFWNGPLYLVITQKLIFLISCEIRQISCTFRQISWNPPENLINQIIQEKLVSFMECRGRLCLMISHEIHQISRNLLDFMKSATKDQQLPEMVRPTFDIALFLYLFILYYFIVYFRNDNQWHKN